MPQIYDVRPDGVYVPVRRYQHARKIKMEVVLAGVLHTGEKKFYQHVDRILQGCDVVIYEQPFPRDQETMQQLDDDWRKLLYDEDLDEAFLASIYLPMPPQKFIRNHGLKDESHCFDYSQSHWLSGDGAWGQEAKDAALPDEVWQRIRKAIRTLDTTVKQEKVAAAKKFLQGVDVETASMRAYVDFRNLHEEEIERSVNKHTVVDPRDEMTLGVFDKIVSGRKPVSVGILFGNGHVPGMDTLLHDRGYVLREVTWLRVLTLT